MTSAGGDHKNAQAFCDFVDSFRNIQILVIPGVYNQSYRVGLNGKVLLECRGGYKGSKRSRTTMILAILPAG